MNEAQVRAVPGYGGFEAQFRKVHKAGWHAVEVNGVAQLYATEADAKIAAYEALHRHLFGDGIVRSGEKVAVANAEAEFRRIFPGKGRKAVEVVRR